MRAVLPVLLFSKRIYKDQALALGVAHSVTGTYDKMRQFRLALALALELDKEVSA